MGVFSVVVCLATLAWVLVPNFLKPRQPGSIPPCKANCKNLAVAIEMYASHYRGHYPLDLVKLTAGNYLKTIPTCPAAGRDTYSASYTVSQRPHAFTFYCAGNNHGKAFREFRRDATNYPQYTSRQGLLDHP